MAAAAPAHHRDGADLRAGNALAVARERARHVRAGAVMTGVLQHHVHEARAPQTAAAGGIAADIAARLGDHIGRAETRRTRDAAAEARSRRLALALAKPRDLHLRDAALPARRARDVPMMTMSVVTSRMMADVMRVSVTPCAVMRPCRSGSGRERRMPPNTTPAQPKRPAKRNQLNHTQSSLTPPFPIGPLKSRHPGAYANCGVARARRDAAVQKRFRGHSAIIS